MATEIDLHIIADKNLNVEKIKNGLIVELKRMEKIFSSYDPNSELSYVNQKAFETNLPISIDLYRVIRHSLSYGQRSSGLFDITIQPLIKLWDVTNKKNNKMPSKKAIQYVLSFVDYRNIRLKEGNIMFLKKNISIDLGGISKGYIIDRAIDYLKNNGINNALLNIGGDLYALGKKHNSLKWNIGIKNPRIENNPMPIITSISAENQSIATSGDYERFRMSKNGVKLHHILNPRTGYPATKSISTTIIAPTAMQADVVATIVFIMGPVDGLHFIEKEKSVEGMIIYEENGKIKLAMSTGFSSYINQ
ncbi:MAG: FAD:protein FMN transferase [Spirochaetota bacterium]|nr:FAD:protein FMN transferase [Spirochaetota bacterium]